MSRSYTVASCNTAKVRCKSWGDWHAMEHLNASIVWNDHTIVSLLSDAAQSADAGICTAETNRVHLTSHVTPQQAEEEPPGQQCNYRCQVLVIHVEPYVQQA